MQNLGPDAHHYANVRRDCIKPRHFHKQMHIQGMFLSMLLNRTLSILNFNFNAFTLGINFLLAWYFIIRENFYTFVQHTLCSMKNGKGTLVNTLVSKNIILKQNIYKRCRYKRSDLNSFFKMLLNYIHIMIKQ